MELLRKFCYDIDVKVLEMKSVFLISLILQRRQLACTRFLSPELQVNLSSGTMTIDFGGLDRWDFNERQRNLAEAEIAVS